MKPALVFIALAIGFVLGPCAALGQSADISKAGKADGQKDDSINGAVEVEADGADPEPDPDDNFELQEMEAAESAALGEEDFGLPNLGRFQEIEGLEGRPRPMGLRREQLLRELGTDWLRFNRSRPGGLPATDSRGSRVKGFGIPVVINAAVQRYLDFLPAGGSKTFGRWLGRTTRYYPIMQPILRKYGLPEELVAVALVESGLKTSAFSRARASGPWQFMRHTGSRYGLKSDFWLDERRDFIKATDAAARHLKDLYDEFGDWYLAWAAYNAGAGRVRRAMDRSGAQDFWALLAAGELARETRRYVPKIVAAALISRDPERFGFADIKYQPMLEWDTVEVEGMVDLKAAARALGEKFDVLKELNPELRYWCSPPYLKQYSLRVPKGKAALFKSKYKPNVKDASVTFTRHRLRSGETLSHVAQVYRTSISALMSANRIKDPRRIPTGYRLIVPINPCGNPVRGKVKAPKPPKNIQAKAAGRKARRHKVRQGDSLWNIAERYGTTVEKLIKLNGLRSGDVLPLGKVLRLR